MGVFRQQRTDKDLVFSFFYWPFLLGECRYRRLSMKVGKKLPEVSDIIIRVDSTFYHSRSWSSMCV